MGQRHCAFALVYRNYLPAQIKSLLRQGGLRLAGCQNEEQAETRKPSHQPLPTHR
jgi:hypothetical protein